MNTKTEQYDIVIAGAGLVGLSFALSISHLDLSICILETHLPDILTQSKINSRPISLSFGSYQILNALNVWKTVAENACPILSVHVSQKGKMGFTKFTAREEKVPALGFVVPFSQLHTTLYEKAARHKNIIFTSTTSSTLP